MSVEAIETTPAQPAEYIEAKIYDTEGVMLIAKMHVNSSEVQLSVYSNQIKLDDLEGLAERLRDYSEDHGQEAER